MKTIAQIRLFSLLLAVAVWLAGCSSGQDRIVPGENTFTNSIGMKFVLLPAGSFVMGSPPGEPYREKDEQQHKVTISEPFYMQTTEVTQGQWKAVMGKLPKDIYERGADLPLVLVTWLQAREFISKLNTMEGTEKYRLPTEAEWEYAARAGSTTAYFFGDDPSQLGEYAFYGKYYFHEIGPIGQKKPNAWGLYDMYGEVWEWCRDWYDDDYYAESPETDPQGPNTGYYRVIRGGGYLSIYARDLRSAERNWMRQGAGWWGVGFRVVREQ